MIINNHKYIYKQVSEKYGIDPQLVEKVGSFTWQDLNRRISNFENREIYVLKLGTWKFRKRKSENWLRSLSNYRYDDAFLTEEDKIAYENKEKKIAAIRELLKQWDDIILERKQFKNDLNNRSI